jgi:hypothetical protein
MPVHPTFPPEDIPPGYAPDFADDLPGADHSYDELVGTDYDDYVMPHSVAEDVARGTLPPFRAHITESR